ncbi:MAG: SDR family oxidoreductase [Chloroflexia bacterium]
MELEGKVAVITGASGGIGLATARLFGERGARVALAARSGDKLRALEGEIAGSLAIPTDMRDESAVRRMIERAHEHFGHIDVLVNNAGQGMHVPVEKADLGKYRSVFELNVVSVLAAMQAVIPIMREAGGGVIVNVSSGTSKMVIPNLAPYASTKYALNCISLTARIELAPDNIRVCVVYPGITATDFIRNAADVQMTERRGGMMTVETPEQVAQTIEEAVRTEAAETYAESIKERG